MNLPSDLVVWKLTVFDNAGVEARHYFMNSAPDSLHMLQRTFAISYTKSIVVVGGGKITHRVQSERCYLSNNCGAGVRMPGSACNGRRLPNEPLEVALPAMYEHPASHLAQPIEQLSVLNPDAKQPWHSQLGHLTVNSIEETSDPVTHDYP